MTEVDLSGHLELGAAESRTDEWPVDRATRRVDYRLTFARTPTPRPIYPHELCGPDIPDARRSAGAEMIAEWHQEAPLEIEDNDIPEECWLEHFLSMAVNEAVHEVLEYFRVDGELYLDPHGPHEHEIYAGVNALAARLARLKRSTGTTVHCVHTANR